MKVTRKQFDKAQADLPKLREAEATIKAWNDAMILIGPAADLMEISEVTADGNFKCKPKEVTNGQPAKAG